jgi:hypothetical protein
MLAVLLTALLLGPGTDSLPVLTKCDAPKPRLGSLRTSGTVSFIVTRRGAAELTSLVVRDVAAGTVAGFRSALERQLPVCRFRPGRAAGRPDSVRVQARIDFTPDSVQWGALAAATPTDSVEAAAVLPVFSATDTVAFTDARLEERPIVQRCDRPLGTDEVTVKTRVDGHFVEPETPTPRPSAPLAHGDVLLRLVVSASGRVDDSAIDIVQAPTEAHATAARRRVRNCRWVPGRIAGVPVAVRIAGREQF